MNREDVLTMNLHENIRKRPGMYLGSNGSNGIISLISGILKDCIKFSKSKEILFKISITKRETFIIDISSHEDLSYIFRCFENLVEDSNIFSFSALIAVTNLLKIKCDDSSMLFVNRKQRKKEQFDQRLSKKNLVLSFSIDKSIFSDISVNYLKLTRDLSLLAILNRAIQLIVIDLRPIYFNQNYYHFPQGIFYIFEQIIHNKRFVPALQLKHEEVLGENSYQICIANTNWYVKSSITSFANDEATTCGGSLVDGVINGLINACKIHIKRNCLSSFKINKKSVVGGFTIVCSVRGLPYEFGGSFKEKLLCNKVKAEATTVVNNWISRCLKEPTLAEQILQQFNESSLFSYRINTN